MEEESKALKAKPELITIGNRQVSSTGMWNDNLMMDYIETNGKDRWISIGELAKVAWGQNTITTKARARSYLTRIWKAFLIERGLLVVIEYEGPHHRANNVKVFNKDSTEDRQVLDRKLDTLKTRGELSTEQYDKALKLIGVESEIVA
jgi:hypothetical protein